MTVRAYVHVCVSVCMRHESQSFNQCHACCIKLIMGPLQVVLLNADGEEVQQVQTSTIQTVKRQHISIMRKLVALDIDDSNKLHPFLQDAPSP